MAFISPDTIINKPCYFSNLVSFKIIKRTTYTKVGASWKKEVNNEPDTDYTSELRLESTNTTTHKPKCLINYAVCCDNEGAFDPVSLSCDSGGSGHFPCTCTPVLYCTNENDSTVIQRKSINVSIKPGSGNTGRCATNYKEEKYEKYFACSETQQVGGCVSEYEGLGVLILIGTTTNFVLDYTNINRSFNGVKGANSIYNSPPIPSKDRTATALISPLCYSLGKTTISTGNKCPNEY